MLPWAVLQEEDEDCPFFMPGPALFDVVDFRIGRFCVS